MVAQRKLVEIVDIDVKADHVVSGSVHAHEGGHQAVLSGSTSQDASQQGRLPWPHHARSQRTCPTAHQIPLLFDSQRVTVLRNDHQPCARWTSPLKTRVLILSTLPAPSFFVPGGQQGAN